MTVFITYFVAAALLMIKATADDVGVRRAAKITPASHRATSEIGVRVRATGEIMTAVDQESDAIKTIAAHESSSSDGSHAEPSQGAAYGVLVHPDGVWGHQKTGSLIGAAATMICSARLHGSTMPFHLIYGGGESEHGLSVLRTLGWTVDDHTADIPFWKSNYKPVYNPKSAKQQKRRWNKVFDDYVQQREDGWATYFKFHTWQATAYKHVLLVDLDVLFTANPDNILANISRNVEFRASPESHFTDGLNTHFAVIRPSNATFDELVRKANAGDYVPFTNTEQDILEDRFPPQKGYVNKNGMNTEFPHIHGLVNYRLKCDDAAWKQWMATLLEAESPSCADLQPICPP